jgi:crossover junction endodeoxyribonuclease RusA
VSGWQFEVRGTPAPQGSKRHVGRGILVEAGGPRVKAWREAVRSEAQDAIGGDDPLGGPVYLSVTFLMPRPKSHYRTGKHAAELRPDAPMWVAQTPDIDKLIRATLDALTDAGAWHDDRQVADLRARQMYAGGPLRPGALITVAVAP